MDLPQDGIREPARAEGPRQYEFSPEEGHMLGDLGAKMRFVGLLVALLGGLTLLYALLATLAGNLTPALLVVYVTALLLLAIGLWNMRAAAEFQLVEVTVGRDISHLMTALANLRKLYALQYWFGWSALLLLIVVVVFGLFVDTAH